MLTRLLLPTFVLLAGCATTQTADGELGPPKERRCTYYAETGSHISKRICDDDAPKHNMVNMSKEEMRNLQRQMPRFKNVDPNG